jgi:DNA-binding GntR family transcriptional regulator
MRAAVVGHTLERVVEILELRVMLETYLLGRSAARMSAENLEDLRQMSAKMVRSRTHDEWLALNTEFHDTLYAYADAPIAQDLAHQLTLRVQRYVRMVRSSRKLRSGDPNAEHDAILDAVERGDIAEARGHLERHIQRTTEQITRIFKERAAEPKPPRKPARGAASS